MVPSKTPNEMVRRLNEQIAAILATPEVQARLAGLGSDRPPQAPEAFQALLHTETVRLGDLIRKANITTE